MEQESYIPSEFSIESLQNGDERAFEVLFQHLYKGLCFFAAKISKNSMVAEEIASASLLKYWERRRNFDNLKAIKTFLYITVRNAALNQQESAHLRQNYYQDYAGGTENYEEPILDALFEAEVMERIYFAIEQLPSKYGTIIKLAYLEGKKNVEIAKELNIPASTVNTQKARGLSELKKLLPRQTLTILTFLFL
jgi:RNA polymerase sigma-70 factor (ECF subfamily)